MTLRSLFSMAKGRNQSMIDMLQMIFGKEGEEKKPKGKKPEFSSQKIK